MGRAGIGCSCTNRAGLAGGEEIADRADPLNDSDGAHGGEQRCASVVFTPAEITELNSAVRQSRSKGSAYQSPCLLSQALGLRSRTRNGVADQPTSRVGLMPQNGLAKRDAFEFSREIRSAFFLLLTITIIICLLSGCSRAQHTVTNSEPLTGRKNVLIVYLSRTGNTKAIAEVIQQKVGGRLVPLELEKPYPADYTATVQQVVRENEVGYLPPLKTKIDHVEQYDYVFLGFPTWGMQLPPPVKSFLHQYSFKGNTVIPFNTNGGYGVGSSFDTVRELCRQCTVLEGFSTRGGSERDGQYLAIQGVRAEQAQHEVENWLRKIRMLN
jgi:flavodoxin